MNLIKVLGQIAGVGGISLGVFLLVFRDVIRKTIFPRLDQEAAYRLLRLVLLLTWTVAILGIAAWTFVTYATNPGKQSGAEDHFDLPAFREEIASADGLDRLDDFIDSNRGKLVYINAKIPEDYASLLDRRETKEDTDYLKLTTDKLDSHLVLRGSGHQVGWYKGTIILAGYFAIEENVEMHQGTVYVLNSVSAAEVLLRTRNK